MATLKEGDVVTYADEHGKEHHALVTAAWGVKEYTLENPPSINLVIVDESEGAHDSYGQQLIRHTSVVHQSRQAAHGRFWRGTDEAW